MTNGDGCSNSRGLLIRINRASSLRNYMPALIAIFGNGSTRQYGTFWHEKQNRIRDGKHNLARYVGEPGLRSDEINHGGAMSKWDCAHCYFWVRWLSTNELGDCRRNAPVAHYHPKTARPLSKWPVTNWNDRCGEWRLWDPENE